MSQDLIRSASDVHRVAAIVLQSLSEAGTVPIHTELVAGGTNIFGDQIGFTANVVVTSTHLTMDVVFNQVEGGTAWLPEDVRFQMDGSGEMSVIPLPADARMQVEEALAARDLVCEAILAAAIWSVR